MDTQTAHEAFTVRSEKFPIDWTGIALFIVLAFGISWAIWLGLAAAGVPFTIGIIGLLPTIAFAIWLAVTGRLKPDLQVKIASTPIES